MPKSHSLPEIIAGCSPLRYTAFKRSVSEDSEVPCCSPSAECLLRWHIISLLGQCTLLDRREPAAAGISSRSRVFPVLGSRVEDMCACFSTFFDGRFS